MPATVFNATPPTYLLHVMWQHGTYMVPELISIMTAIDVLWVKLQFIPCVEVCWPSGCVAGMAAKQMMFALVPWHCMRCSKCVA